MRRGEIYQVDLEPTRGGEQRGHRRVLVVSADTFNRNNIPIVCPITTGAVSQRYRVGLTVSLTTAGTDTAGVVLCGQIRALDLRDRRARRIETVPAEIMSQVLGCLQDLFEE